MPYQVDSKLVQNTIQRLAVVEVLVVAAVQVAADLAKAVVEPLKVAADKIAADKAKDLTVMHIPMGEATNPSLKKM